MFSKLLFVLSVFSLLINYCRSNWSYQENNPQEWINQYPQCGDILQSPINIETANAKVNLNLGPIEFINYDQIIYWNFTNNGHTIFAHQIFSNESKPFITGSDFGEDILVLDQFHFHWGINPSIGSEHHIDGQPYPLEIRFEIILLKISEANNTNLTNLLSLIGDDVAENTWNTTYLAIDRILPDLDVANTNAYYRYVGSLTTPPCTEGVLWSIFRKKIPISKVQITSFYKNEILFNNRPVQKLNNRPLYISVSASNKLRFFWVSNIFFILILNYSFIGS